MKTVCYMTNQKHPIVKNLFYHRRCSPNFLLPFEIQEQADQFRAEKITLNLQPPCLLKKNNHQQNNQPVQTKKNH